MSATTIVSSSSSSLNDSNQNILSEPLPWMGRNVVPSISPVETSIAISVFSTNATSKPLEDDFKRILTFPKCIQDEIETFGVVDIILELVQSNKAIPDYLIRKAKQVTYLNLGNIKLSNQQTLQLLSCFKNLESLTMPQTYQTAFPTRASTPCLLDIVTKIASFKKLNSLDMSTWTDNSGRRTLLTDEILKIIISEGRLQHLNIARSSKLTTKGISYLTGCEELHYLNLSSCRLTNDSLSHVAKISSLTHLDISANELLTDEGIHHLSTLKNLKKFIMCGLLHVIGDALITIGTLCNLDFLDISCSYGLKLSTLSPISNLLNLETLSIQNCPNICDVDLSYVGKCVKLKNLNTLGCANLSANSLSNISNLEHLDSLDIRYCRKINNDSLNALHKLSNLKSIKIYGTQIDSTGIDLITEKIPLLKVENDKDDIDFPFIRWRRYRFSGPII